MIDITGKASGVMDFILCCCWCYSVMVQSDLKMNWEVKTSHLRMCCPWSGATWLFFPLMWLSWLSITKQNQKANIRTKQFQGWWQLIEHRFSVIHDFVHVPLGISITHLVAVHLVAMFEGECFSQGNVDGVAHNGHRKCVTYYLWEQCDVWETRGLESGKEKANASIFMVHFITVILRNPYTKTPIQIAHGIKAAQILRYILYILDYRNVTKIFVCPPFLDIN